MWSDGLILGLFGGSSWGVRGGIFVRKYQGIVCRKLNLTADNRSDLSPAQIRPDLSFAGPPPVPRDYAIMIVFQT